MTSDADTTYSIGEASERTGIAAHTLRFYEREGLFLEPIRRDHAGRRRFTGTQIDWLQIGGRLRLAGMPLPEIRRYAEAAQHPQDAATVQLRLLQDHELRIRSQLTELEQVLAIVTEKITHHHARIETNTAPPSIEDTAQLR